MIAIVFMLQGTLLLLYESISIVCKCISHLFHMYHHLSALYQGVPMSSTLNKRMLHLYIGSWHYRKDWLCVQAYLIPKFKEWVRSIVSDQGNIDTKPSISTKEPQASEAATAAATAAAAAASEVAAAIRDLAHARAKGLL